MKLRFYVLTRRQVTIVAIVINIYCFILTIFLCSLLSKTGMSRFRIEFGRGWCCVRRGGEGSFREGGVTNELDSLLLRFQLIPKRHQVWLVKINLNFIKDTRMQNIMVNLMTFLHIHPPPPFPLLNKRLPLTVLYLFMWSLNPKFNHEFNLKSVTDN